MKLEEMSKKIIKIMSKYVELYFYEPLEAKSFYLKHQKVIDSVFEWNKNSKKEQAQTQTGPRRLRQLKSWMEFMNQ